ncbi:MAG: hypothetical protein DMF87_00450 [Acidobacteria bacterium]|nr:MAG: hypothetical protein DMF87_00450 [Acidobacteriota bacterium]
MFPAQYQLLVAASILMGGVIACFFGYRLFRTVLAIIGFGLGALMATSVFGISNATMLVAAGVVGGLIGAFILIAAYFVGVALAGASIGAVVANVLFSIGGRDPRVIVVIFLAIAGAVAATYLQRYFIIVFTAFGGAWTMIVGAMALVGNRTALKAATSGDVWVAYPMNPAPGQRWVVAVWIFLSLLGAVVQVGITGGEKGRVVKRKKKQ